MDKPITPAHLGPGGSAMWAKVTDTYGLRPDELRLLEDSCREIDMIDRLEAEQRDKPLTVKGSQGQIVASPLVSEVRQHRTVLRALFAQLKLPDDGAAANATSDAARKAADSRWHQGKSA